MQNSGHTFVSGYACTKRAAALFNALDRAAGDGEHTIAISAKSSVQDLTADGKFVSKGATLTLNSTMPRVLTALDIAAVGENAVILLSTCADGTDRLRGWIIDCGRPYPLTAEQLRTKATGRRPTDPAIPADVIFTDAPPILYPLS